MWTKWNLLQNIFLKDIVQGDYFVRFVSSPWERSPKQTASRSSFYILRKRRRRTFNVFPLFFPKRLSRETTIFSSFACCCKQTRKSLPKKKLLTRKMKEHDFCFRDIYFLCCRPVLKSFLNSNRLQSQFVYVENGKNTKPRKESRKMRPGHSRF